MWLMRDLSIYARVLLAKAEGIHVYMSLSINICKELDKMLFNFMWRNKAHYLKKEILCNQTETEGWKF